MRSLSRAETRVIASLLTSGPTTLSGRIEASGLPRRTFEVARRRMLGAGWLVERYVPDPSLLGYPNVTFAFGSPFAEKLRLERERWSRAKGVVALWETTHHLFGVFLGNATDGQSSAMSELVNNSSYSYAYTLSVQPTAAQLPAYFDFEGEWARVIHGRPSSYPHPLNTVHPDEEGDESGRARRLVRLLKETLSVGPSDGGEVGAAETSSLPRHTALQEGVSRGYLARRTFLNPGILPGYGRWRLRQVLFIHAALRQGRTAPGLFRDLVERCQVAPFLFAGNSDHVLLAGLSPSPPPRLPTEPPRRASMLGTLATYLEKIEVRREPVDGIKVHINHDFGRLAVDS